MLNDYKNLFITNTNHIMDILDESEQIYLYDTVAISHHELVFYRNGEKILKDFINRDGPIIITDTILKETRMAEDVEHRYLSYFEALDNKIILINEKEFFNLIDGNFKPKEKAKAKFKECSKKAFQTIQSLAETCNMVSNNDPAAIIKLFGETFMPDRTNKGEYSLLWLSCILKMTNPSLKINFIGVDRDLYSIVDQCYFQKNEQTQQGIQILSTDTIVQALYRIEANEELLNKFCWAYRKEDRKVLYQRFHKGILEKHICEDPISNEVFLELTVSNEIVVVY
jgi:hypothetical protein